MADVPDTDALTAELEYYRQRIDRLAGDTLRRDYLTSELRHQLRQNRQAFSLLAELQRSIQLNSETTHVFDDAVRGINAQLSMDRTLVLAPTETLNAFRPAHWIGYREESAARLGAATFVFPESFLAGSQSLLVNGTSDRTPLVEQLREALEIPYFVAVPLRSDEGVLGVLLSGRLREVKPVCPPLDVGDVDTFRALASFISTGIRNKRIGVLEETLRVAARIQGDLLPKSTPTLEGYELVGRTLPAQIVGGDYYDFIVVDEGRCAICLGDVAGKGLPAALLMANLQASIRGQTLWSPSAADCMTRANRLLFLSTDPGSYATLVYGVLNTRSHYFSYTNGGHNAPMLVHRQEVTARLTTGGTVLGLFQNSKFEEDVVHLDAGDVLVLYSDGVTEAVDTEGREFGETRLASLLTEQHQDPAGTLADRILNSVILHGRGMPQADDITLVVVKRMPPNAPARRTL